MLDDEATQREMAALLNRLHQPGEREVFVRQRSSLAARLAALDGRWIVAADGFAEALRDEVALDHYGQAGELRMRWAHALLRSNRLDDAALGEHAWAVNEWIDDAVLVDEQSILAAQLWLWERCRLWVEPAAAVGIAAIRQGLIEPAMGDQVVAVMSGANVSLPS
jgi:hypothetical protein